VEKKALSRFERASKSESVRKEFREGILPLEKAIEKLKVLGWSENPAEDFLKA
jgi:hypothetical protein